MGRACRFSCLCSAAFGEDGRRESIIWQPWSDSVFAQAKSEGRFVLLDLERSGATGVTSWTRRPIATRRSSALSAAISRGESRRGARPDLSNRYEDYGWPATIVFNSDGSEIVKRRGYLPPSRWLRCCRRSSTIRRPALPWFQKRRWSRARRTRLELADKAVLRQFGRGYDHTNRGWGTGQKFLDWDTIEYCLDQTDRRRPDL